MSEPITKRITAALEQLQQAHPEMRFGQLVMMVAELARGFTVESIYDVEDAEFLSAAEEHLQCRPGEPNRTPERRAV